MKRFLFLICILTAYCAAQVSGPSGAPVLYTDGPPFDTWTKLAYSQGSNMLFYCYAPATVKAYTLTVTGVAVGNTTALTLESHGFDPLTNPKVTLSGVTGTAAAAMNQTFVATVSDANTITIPANTNGLVASGAIKLTATAPRVNQPVWQIQKLVDSLGTTSMLWAADGRNATCSNRLALAYQ